MSWMKKLGAFLYYFFTGEIFYSPTPDILAICIESRNVVLFKMQKPQENQWNRLERQWGPTQCGKDAREIRNYISYSRLRASSAVKISSVPNNWNKTKLRHLL